mmetsp:Transcript_42487/g.72274  ORF Transcript_42487/g.72274 Transcript_42487/m.72274 type:complete len:221 (-) Transcript_42487:334-996(-)
MRSTIKSEEDPVSVRRTISEGCGGVQTKGEGAKQQQQLEAAKEVRPPFASVVQEGAALLGMLVRVAIGEVAVAMTTAVPRVLVPGSRTPQASLLSPVPPPPLSWLRCLGWLPRQLPPRPPNSRCTDFPLPSWRPCLQKRHGPETQQHLRQGPVRPLPARSRATATPRTATPTRLAYCCCCCCCCLIPSRACSRGCSLSKPSTPHTLHRRRHRRLRRRHHS